MVPLGMSSEQIALERVERIKACDYEHALMPKLPDCINEESFNVRLIQSAAELADLREQK